MLSLLPEDNLSPYLTDLPLIFVVQSLSLVRPFVTPKTAGFPILHHLPELMSIESGMSFKHLILCYPLLLPSIFPSIRVFSSESVLWIRWPKYWSFSFSISLSKEYSGLIPFRTDCFDLLAVQGTHEYSSVWSLLVWCKSDQTVEYECKIKWTKKQKSVNVTREFHVG